MDAFDADVLIYAADREHEPGQRVRALFAAATSSQPCGTGSVLLLPELLSKPLRERDTNQIAALGALLARLDLREIDRATAELATGLAATYRLQATDATHLAAAVVAGADRFLTNNRRDFPRTIAEIEIVYPEDLPEPEAT